MPYVYKLVNMHNNEYYYGFRKRNVKINVPSHIDILTYQSSSKIVANIGFEKFKYIILAEFFNWEDAFDFEQSLIIEHWNDPLMLNQSIQYHSKLLYKNTTHEKSVETRKQTGSYITSEVTKLKLSQACTGRNISREHKQKLSIAKKNKPGRIQSPEERCKRSLTMLGHKKQNILVCRLQDKKVMTLCSFTKWCNQSYTRPSKIGTYKKLVCRIIDKKEMTIGKFYQWLRSS